MKKFLCIILAIMMLVPVGTAALAMNAGAEDVLKAEPVSNTASAENSAKNAEGATISGKVNVSFSFNNDGKATLLQGGHPVKVVNIAADGSYLFDKLSEGTYDLRISIPGWTENNVTSIDVAENEDVEICENVVFGGDVDQSGVIDVQDVAAALMNIGETVTSTNINSDVDHNKEVCLGDISVILATKNYGQSAFTSSYFNDGWTNPY
ncbi:MAG: hypothetical protein IJI67_06760 [Clostridia bacterium]|nr:hypothetical protein [Clostridia bacterium]